MVAKKKKKKKKKKKNVLASRPFLLVIDLTVRPVTVLMFDNPGRQEDLISAKEGTPELLGSSWFTSRKVRSFSDPLLLRSLKIPSPSYHEVYQSVSFDRPTLF
ncbi:unnamed protein product [Fusarium venenatum]|uniref:Uncharacterized protein n=1 Tax=Fusarium venenatum TaxID=56646 RepID=A0A2L2SNT4_9HYPO|nr:uncharacterized protein FVRRES_11987 [Fusarium venenatum]CEI39296.1 unnamed protein product [Fusarium venenatum]